jgi:hypothetical protein
MMLLTQWYGAFQLDTALSEIQDCSQRSRGFTRLEKGAGQVLPSLLASVLVHHEMLNRREGLLVDEIDPLKF